jgi:hypothetical protein
VTGRCKLDHSVSVLGVGLRGLLMRGMCIHDEENEVELALPKRVFGDYQVCDMDWVKTTPENAYLHGVALD